MTLHGITDLSPNDETQTGRATCSTEQVHLEIAYANAAARTQNRPEVHRSSQPVLLGQHASGADAGAALPPAGVHDGAAGTGTHPQAESVPTGPTSVVRLKRTLGHSSLLELGCLAATVDQPQRGRKRTRQPRMGKRVAGLSGDRTARRRGSAATRYPIRVGILWSPGQTHCYRPTTGRTGLSIPVLPLPVPADCVPRSKPVHCLASTASRRTKHPSRRVVMNSKSVTKMT